MAKVRDAKQNRYVWDSNPNTTDPKTSSSGGNKTYYGDVTGEPTTKNVADTGKWDTSYVQQSAYGRDWSNWDYTSDVTVNKDRWAQIKSNLEKDAISNPKLFTNRADFEKYYHYSERHPSQQKLLNEAWDNYGKLGMSSSENLRADKASEVNQKMNDELVANAADKYSRLMPAINAIAKKFEDRLWPVFTQLQEYQAKYLNDMSELRKLQNDYYAWMKREYDALAAGQSASVGSTLSWQWLSQSAIASTVDWVDKNWQSRYNDLMWKHIETLKGLQDSEQNFMNAYGNLMWTLSTAENTALKTWIDSWKTLEDELKTTKDDAIKSKYAPYQEITWAYVKGAAEWAESTGKKEDVASDYKGKSTDGRAQILNSYLKSYFWEDADLSKYTPYLRQAALKDDITEAMTYLANAIKQSWWTVPKKDTPTLDPSNIADIPKFGSFAEYQKAWWKLSEAMYNYYHNKK